MSDFLPDAINKFVENRNIAQVRDIQRDIHALYRIDASQYDEEKKLVIRKVYDLIPSNMENKKKRIVVKKLRARLGISSLAIMLMSLNFLPTRVWLSPFVPSAILSFRL